MKLKNKIYLFTVLVLILPFNFFSKTNKTEKYLIGADLSHHQGKIKWSKGDKELFDFIYIKSTEGKSFKDSEFKNNWIGTKKVGILRGAYHVFRPEISGKTQSKNFIDVVPKEKNSLPPAVDLVSLYEVDIKDKNKVQKEIKILLNALENYYGKKPILYVSRDMFNKFLKGSFNNVIWTWNYKSRREPKNFDKNQTIIWQHTIAVGKKTKYKKFTKNFGLDLDYFIKDKNMFEKTMSVKF